MAKKNIILGLIVSSYHPIQLKVKIMDQTWENGEKSNFGTDFGLFSQNLGRQFFFLSFISTRC